MNNIFLEFYVRRFYFLMTNIQWAFPENFLRYRCESGIHLYLLGTQLCVHCAVLLCVEICLQLLFALIPME